LDNVSKAYGTAPVLRDCSLTVRRGEVVVICGPSGSGKSTPIKCIDGLEPYHSRSNRSDRTEGRASSTTLPKLRTRIRMVFQHFEVEARMWAMDTIMLAQVHALGRARADARARAETLLARVGLSDKADARPANLSGGQQQRVAIARALALDPEVILFDEPTSALDPEMISDVLDVMVGLARDGMTMLVVTHEMGFARRVAHRVVFMDNGEVIEDTLKTQFFSEPKSKRAQEFLSKILGH